MSDDNNSKQTTHIIAEHSHEVHNHAHGNQSTGG